MSNTAFGLCHRITKREHVPIWFTSIKLLLLLISDIYNALSTSNNIVLEWKLHYIDCLIEKLHYIDCLIERYWQYVKITLHRLPDREVTLHRLPDREVLTIHLATLHVLWPHLQKRKSQTIVGLFCVPLEFQTKMKNWILRHSIVFLNYTSDLANSYIAGSAKCPTKHISKLLTSILSAVKNSLQSYTVSLWRYTYTLQLATQGVVWNQMWILKNSKDPIKVPALLMQ